MKVAILASGSGSNLQSILEQVAKGALNIRPALVVSDVAGARALQRARDAGITTRLIAPGDYADRSAWTCALSAALSDAQVELVVLAGFMRIVDRQLLQDFPGKVLNIHPSLLPRYRGLHTYRRVLAAGDSEHGSSVHFVTEELDGGPVIAQVRLAVRDGDSEQSLRARVQTAEHWLYPLVIGWFAAGRLRMRDEQAWLDGEPLTEPVVFAETGPV